MLCSCHVRAVWPGAADTGPATYFNLPCSPALVFVSAKSCATVPARSITPPGGLREVVRRLGGRQNTDGDGASWLAGVDCAVTVMRHPTDHSDAAAETTPLSPGKEQGTSRVRTPPSRRTALSAHRRSQDTPCCVRRKFG